MMGSLPFFPPPNGHGSSADKTSPNDPKGERGEVYTVILLPSCSLGSQTDKGEEGEG